MLLEFSVKNFLSIKDEVTLSLYASDEVQGHERFNLIPVGEQAILKTAVIYGANASGKSNLIKAMEFMRRVIVTSIKLNPEEPIVSIQNYPSFQLSTETAKEPIEMEVSFLYKDIYYRYGFVFDAKKIHREWLYHAPAECETLLYERRFKKNKYEYEIPESFIIAKSFTEENSLPENTLLLAVLAKFTDTEARRVMEWVRNTFNVIPVANEEAYAHFTRDKLSDEDYRAEILNFLKVADLGIENVTLEPVTADDLPDDIPKKIQKKLKKLLSDDTKRVVFQHKVFNDKGKVTGEKEWGANNESEGTQKLFALSAPLIETLRNGEILVIDELDAKLHPMMMRFILGLFHSREHNPHNAQLIFATHDTQLLNQRFFRRDQIRFTEKNSFGATDLYSLDKFDLDDKADFSRDYFQGLYNAVPFIGDLKLFDVGGKNGKR